MKKSVFFTGGIVMGMIAMTVICACVTAQIKTGEEVQKEVITSAFSPSLNTSAVILPDPDHSDSLTLDTALADRRSEREYLDTPVTLQQISNILWAAQGITDSEGRRTAPSGQRIYPLTLHLVVNRADGLLPGVYSYSAKSHLLTPELDETGKNRVAELLGKNGKTAPLSIVMSGNYTPYQKFGTDMANQSIYLEAGHVAQNILLELTSLKLSGVPYTGFNQEAAGDALKLPGDQRVVYAVSLGKVA